MSGKKTVVHEHLVSVTNAGEGEIFEIIKGTGFKIEPCALFQLPLSALYII